MSRRNKGLIVLLLTAMWLPGAAYPKPRGASGSGTMFSVGYLPNITGWSVSSINYKAFTHLVEFAITPNRDGSFNTSSVARFSRTASLIRTAHANGVKVLLGVGGDQAWAPAFRTIASNPSTRAKFVSNVIRAMLTHGYDGIDLDWEDPDADRSQYQSLYAAFRTAMNRHPGKILSAPTALNWYGEVFWGAVQSVDFVSEMCYGTHPSKMASYYDGRQGTNWLGPPYNLPKSRWAIGIGMDPGEKEAHTTPALAKAQAQWAKDNGFGGIMVWGIWRDIADNDGAGQAALVEFVRPH
jgi:chitinase